ncbi:MAG: phosphoglucosamine mutase [Candidatus Sericytochromatia bacterium]|nr:phosphoglucosamine mutase [Candidatus Sericytochromatia bacterium]
MGKYFGTDGIRGLAGEDLTADLALRLGRALAEALGGSGRRFVVVGRDTRRSGTMLESALAAGLAAGGVDARLVGVVPTPAVAWLTRHLGAAAGVMISASHNPAPDNGLKVFSGEGFKLPDEVEARLEELIDRAHDLSGVSGPAIGVIRQESGILDAYEDHLAGLLPTGLKGWRIVVDTAHGAASGLAARVLGRMGAAVVPIGDAPDGDNINEGCGSTQLAPLQAAVLEQEADLGLAFDGDADRCLAVAEDGTQLDGDLLMLLCLRQGLANGRWDRPDLVATVMSNLGLEEAVQDLGGTLKRAKVGDRYVLEDMRAAGIGLGGEQSGHIIDLSANTTGDGLVTALRVLEALSAIEGPASRARALLTIHPQLLRNVRVPSVQGWDTHAAITEAIRQAEERLQGQGRLLVRASGTEPLIRVMAEGRDATLVQQVVSDVCQAVAHALNPKGGKAWA